jgi:23S rRNA (adenine-N6)-dimethyltransferase
MRRVVASAATDALLILQREAAQKFAGTPRETLFSLLHKPWFDTTIGRSLRRSDFAPAPSIDSVVLHLHRREAPLLASRDRDAWRAFVRAGFGAATVRDALRDTHTWHEIARLERELRFLRHDRPSWLTFEQWLALFRSRRQGRAASLKQMQFSARRPDANARPMTNHQ